MATDTSSTRALARPARRGALLLATVLAVSACATVRAPQAVERAASDRPTWRQEAALSRNELPGMKDALQLLTANPAGLLEMLKARRGTALAAEVPTRSFKSVADLSKKRIQLSYVDAGTALSMLKIMGIETFDFTPRAQKWKSNGTVETFGRDAPPENWNAAGKPPPYVIGMPDPGSADFGLVAATTTEVSTADVGGATKKGTVTAVNAAGAISPNAYGSPMTQLMVMYDPAHPEQFARIRRMIDEHIDRPARQVLIEGMVLEIDEDGLEELGVRWELKKLSAGGAIERWTGGAFETGGSETLLLGDIIPGTGDAADTVNPVQIGDLGDTEGFDWSVKLQALVRDGKAEVLSRPSVVTLNNRQSTIRVGEDLPIATGSTVGTTSTTSFAFSYLPTGIQLNIRPRINEAGNEVTMLIDTTVSSTEGTGDPLELKDSDGNVLASAPIVNTRRVQTYARVPNNMPIIIGGLVSRIDQTDVEKVPVLGDLPLVGAAFRASSTRQRRREVIIVLTPYVLPESRERVKPLDSDRFDNFDNALFRDSYRLRREDVFDLSFLYEDPALREFREVALEAVAQDPRRAEQSPYSEFIGEAPPGQDVLATRMLFELLERLDDREGIVESGLDDDRIIMLDRTSKERDSYRVRFLQGRSDRQQPQTLSEEFCGAATMRTFFNHHQGRKALRITFLENDSRSHAAGPIGPNVGLVNCASEEDYRDELWKWNQGRHQGRRLRTILLRNEDDLGRLRYALALKRLIALNGGPDEVLRKRLDAGAMLLIPDLRPEQGQVMDAEVATYFFRRLHYYSAAIGEIDRATRELAAEVRKPAK